MAVVACGGKWIENESYGIVPILNSYPLARLISQGYKYDYFSWGTLKALSEKHPKETFDIPFPNTTRLQVIKINSSINLSSFKKILRPFQLDGVKFLVNAKRSYLGDEMGLGKTIQALAWIESQHLYPALIVCPAFLRLNWAREIDECINRNYSIIGTSHRLNSDIVIVSYEGMKDVVKTDWKFKVIVLDESHYIKEFNSARTRRIISFAKNTPYRACLSGTATLNRKTELLAQIAFLERSMDCGGFNKLIESTEEETYNILNDTFYLRRLRKDVLNDLPEIQRVIIPISLKSNYLTYAVEEDRIKRSMLGIDPIILGGGSAARIDYLRLLSARGKLPEAIKWIKHMMSNGKLHSQNAPCDSQNNSGSKLAFYCYHREIHDSLIKAFPGIPYIHGDVKQNDRMKAIDRFNNDPNCNLILCTFAASQGINLTGANFIAVMELGWNDSIHSQIESRACRIGNKHSVISYFLLGENTIDIPMQKMIERKRIVTETIMNGKASENSSDMQEITDYLRNKR